MNINWTMDEEYKNLSVIYDVKCACFLLLEKNKTKWRSTFYVRIIERKPQSIWLDKCNYYKTVYALLVPTDWDEY